MNILLLGSGGREHAFAWKLSESPLLDALFIAPGNGGTDDYGANVDLAINDFEAIGQFVLENEVGMVVVGPEDPLVNGIYDYFQEHDTLKSVPVIGPSKAGAALEGSKAFAKQFMVKHGIPTAPYKEFNSENLHEGAAWIDQQTPPIVLKADGLAAGKGVLICATKEEAKQELEEMIAGGKFGKAGATVVIEQFLKGVEFSFFVITDGVNYKILPHAKDYKRIGEGDTGLNTGGMGCVSPVPFVNNIMRLKVKEQVINPTMKGLQQDGIVYKGFLYIGLMSVDGEPFVIEYNCRMGDPETEVVLPRLKSDLLKHLIALSEGTLQNETIEIDHRATATVIAASGGYPGNYEKGKEITGLNDVKKAMVFHAGTKAEDGKILTNGGRVLAVTSYGKDIHEAVAQSNAAIEKINFEGKYYRKDIGYEFK
jgi:phosphoribosylamine--glycine ligase